MIKKLAYGERVMAKWAKGIFITGNTVFKLESFIKQQRRKTLRYRHLLAKRQSAAIHARSQSLQQSIEK